MIRVVLINGASFLVRSQDFARGTNIVTIKRQTGRNLVLASSYVVSANK